MKFGFAVFLAAAAMAQSWELQNSGTTASLRGVSAVNARVVWASGSGGTFLKTTDDGSTWAAAKVPGAEELDFRDVHAVGERVAYLLSSGPEDRSRIYRTGDGGAHWRLLFTNPDAKGFFDSFAFWDARHGIVVGDPVDGRFVVLTTNDGGEHWERRPTPPAIPEEGAFAASGTCLVVSGKSEAWFATGGPKGARVFHTADGGASWTVAVTPIRNDGPSAGIFSLAFFDARHGVAVGGDYNQPAETRGNVAVTVDGGRTWTASGAPPAGFRSAVAWLSGRKLWIATGTSGSDFSTDGGRTWKRFDGGAFNAIGVADGDAWAVGPRGRIARFRP
jgi:photosystem II stability/assembly factor-like uncharacterized protein